MRLLCDVSDLRQAAPVLRGERSLPLLDSDTAGWSATRARGLGSLAWLLAIASACGGERVKGEQLVPAAQSAWRPRSEVHAFYSGHSLSDGVPELIEAIASARGERFEYEVQTAGYSLLRERTKGKDPTAAAYTGYRSGNNRVGSGLDVAAELRAPTRLSRGARYDALVVTERHDLPMVAWEEETPLYLAHIAEQLRAGNPKGEVYFYHSWLDLNVEDPLAWVAYERSVGRMWECVASRANQLLGSAGDVPVVRVLPGGSALAELVAALWEGKAPGLERLTPEARVRLLFRDNVHPTLAGRYYMALLHYAVLYGRSPEGAAVPSTVDPALATYMQRVASEQALRYGRIANAAARRDLAACRDYAQREVCPSYHRLRSGEVGFFAALERKAKVYVCQRHYGEADGPRNPFGRVAP